MDNQQTDRLERLTLALNHLRSALEKLDAGGAPAQIGAHVDLAIHQLQDTLAVAAPDGAAVQIDTKAEPQ